MTGTAVPLLDTIVRDALDPSYAEAAARRHRAGTCPPRSSGGRRRTTAAGAVLLIAAGLVTGFAVSFQHQTLPQVGAARSALAGDAGERTQQLKDLEQSLAARQRDVTTLQQGQLQASSAGRLLQRQSDALAAAAGQTAVVGPGVTVAVSDVIAASSPNAGSGPHGALATRTGRVTDRDIQDVVNALWAGGAEAIAVGGVRLGPQTAIRTAGGSILVDFRPLRSPYLISAIGGPGLFRAVGASSAASKLRAGTSGIHPDLVLRASAILRLPAAAAVLPRFGHHLAPGGHS